MPALAMVLAAACWASTVIANKSIIDLLAVTEITSMRFLIGAAMMFLLAAMAGQLGSLRKVGLGPILMGFLEPGGASLFMVWGVAHTSAISASVIMSTIPILMPVLGWAVLREPMRASVLIGAAFAVAGTILLVQGQSAHAGGDMKGDLLVLIGVLFVCANQLVARRVAQAHGSAVAVSALQLSAAALLSMAVLATIERPPVYLAHFDGEIAATVVFIGFMGGAIPFVLYNFSLRYLPVGNLALFVSLIAPMGALMAWAYLDTPVTGTDALAIAMVVFGVAMPTLLKRIRVRS
jgi:drug/metabolite transporter (DMT)-like permease